MYVRCIALSVVTLHLLTLNKRCLPSTPLYGNKRDAFSPTSGVDLPNLSIDTYPIILTPTPYMYDEPYIRRWQKMVFRSPSTKAAGSPRLFANYTVYYTMF